MEDSRKSRIKDSVLKIVTPLAAVAILLVAWELIVTINKIPVWVIAKPTEIFTAFIKEFKTIWPNMWMTLKTILIAYPIAVILALIVGALITTSEFVSAGIGNYIIFLVCTPMMTLVPLLSMFLGFGILPRIIVTALQTFPIMNMNACVGFLNVPLERRELMYSLKANKFQTFFKVTLPSSANQIFNGLRLGFIECITCCIAAEFAGGNEGLGAAIVTDTHFMRVPLAFASIIAVAIIGITLYNFINSMEGVIKKWKD